ncbi:MAG: N-6 DNA methylase [Chloroflexota bacterium]
MSDVKIKADDSAFDNYYARLGALKGNLKLKTEGSTRRAFSALLEETAKVRSWTLAEEVTRRRKNHRIRLDGVLYGKGNLPRGYWEAKDEGDDLSTEIIKKRAKEYPVGNIIFEDTTQAILIQDGIEVATADVRDRDALAYLLTRFFNHEMEPFEEFDKAVDWFADVIPDIGGELKQKIDDNHKSNPKFRTEFEDFMELCRNSLNPNISKEAVNEMLIQHLLTERLIRNIFQRDFTRRNVIANKVEDVIDALTSPLFDRSDFQQSLDTFYDAIEGAANSLAENFQEKQEFINTVYEQFFQGYSVKTADTHGIVYTPQEIVDFMCAAVEEVLQDEFGKKLGEDGVAVLDPATGTGNFIINLLNRVHPRYRRQFYKNSLFANEVMLMPYYIASLNIEHEYYDLEGEYEPFEGLAFVDTLDLAKRVVDTADGRMTQNLLGGMFTEKNSARVQRQQNTDITVIIGNPPYNIAQVNENDNNKNRSYDVIDERVRQTYGKDSTATLNRALYDPVVKFFRWASDRLGDNDGVICYVTNNSFVDLGSFDGMRKHLFQDFQRIYHLDLHGNVRRNSKLSGTTHNVFGIQTGVGITVAIRKKSYQSSKLYYYRLGEYWTRQDKLSFLRKHVEKAGRHNSLNTVEWEELEPNSKHTWLLSEFANEFEDYLPIGSKEDKRASRGEAESIFKLYGAGALTARDDWVLAFTQEI